LNRFRHSHSKSAPYLFLAAFLILTQALFAQSIDEFAWHHIHTAYTTEDHQAGETSTSIIEDAQGHIFVGNERGLLKFDGVQWSLMPETGHSSYVMSIAADSAQNIWVAGMKSVGYYSATPSGQYIYNDMTSSVTTAFEGKDLGTFWKLYSHEKAIFLITSEHVLRWTEGKWRSWKFEDERRILPSWTDDGLYIHARGTGVFHFNGNEFEQIAQANPEVASGIIGILGNTSKGVLCATVNNGIFYLKDGSYRRAFPLIPDSQTLHAFICPNNNIILSTSHDGVFIISITGETLRHIPYQKPIFYTMSDSYGTIWSAGIGTILMIPRLPLTYYADTAYRMQKYAGDLYYSNGSSLQRISHAIKGQQEQQILDTGTHIWCIQTVDDQLLYGDINSLNFIHNKNNTPRKVHTPREISSIYHSRQDPNIIYVTDLPRISRWQKKSDRWQYLDSLQDFQSGAISVAEIAHSKLLISGENSPLLMADWEQANSIQALGQESGLPAKFTWAYILQRDELTIVISNKGLYKYNTLSGKFVYDPVLGEDLGNDAYALSHAPTASQLGWVLYLPSRNQQINPVGKLIWEQGRFTWTPYHLPSSALAGRVHTLLNEVNESSDEILWLGGSKNILRYNISQMPTYTAPATKLTQIGEQETAQLYYNGAGSPPQQISLDFPQRSLYIDYASSPTPIKVTRYQTRLAGYNESWSDPHASTSRVFTNLPSGSYTFEVRAIDEFGRIGTGASLQITILAPWYNTPYAYATYVIIGLFLLTGLNYLKNQSLRLRNERLSALVQQRTQELEAQKQELQKANKAKQNFLASISHEIRNPLNGIIGISQLLKQREDEQGTASEETTHLYSCSQHLNQLLSQTLDYSSLEAGKLRTRVESFAPAELLQEVLQIQTSMAHEKGIELEVEKPDIKHNWKGDPVLLRQILINLVSNAIKYSNKGVVRVILSYQASEETVDACFEVIDSGPGVPQGHEHIIFQEFTRLPDSEMSHIPGTGLGLTISAEMARLMGGSLTLDSKYHGGARFVLNLQFEIELFRRKTKANHTQEGSEILKGKRVLIADDMNFNRYISTAVLDSMGAEIDVAENGRIALNKLQSSHYEIVILDISMPELSGIEVVEAYLEQHEGHCPKFIALSAYNSLDAEERCIAAGFNHFIEKPLEPEKLKKLLKRHHRKSPNSTGSDLLAYLSKNGPMSLKELQAEYNQSLREELDKLKIAFALDRSQEQDEVIHKLLGLCRVQQCEAISTLVEKISASSKGGAPREEIAVLIRELSKELDRAATAT